MTFTDSSDNISMDYSKQQLKELGQAVKCAMSRSCKERRLACGVVECARKLESEPEEVMVCILPEVESVSVGINHTLMEAYCREFEIPVLKVDSVSSVKEIFKMHDTPENCNVFNAHVRLERKQSRDFSCFLITKPEVMSSEDHQIQKIFDTVKGNKKFFVQIPD